MLNPRGLRHASRRGVRCGADERFDALLAQVLPDHLELALGVAAERFSATMTGKP
jgi:hypothetical protein